MKRFNIKRWISLGIIGCFLIGLSACGSNSNSTGNTTISGEATAASASVDEDTLYVGVGNYTDLTKIDTIEGYSYELNSVLNNVVETLFYYDEDSIAQPLLVDSYTESEDGTVYVFELKDYITFSDGTNLTAEDVVFSLERHRDADNASLLAWMFESVDTIEATDEYEVTVTLSTPDAMFLNTLCTPAGGIVSKAYYEEHEEDFGTVSGGIVGSGPYEITSWTSGEEVILQTYDGYWNAENTDIDFTTVDVIYYADSNVVTQALEAGQLDYSGYISDENAKELEECDTVTVRSTDTGASIFLSFNNSVEPFDDVNVRKAISYAIDKETIVEQIIGEKYSAVGTSLPFSDVLVSTQAEYFEGFFDSLNTYEYDVDTAKEYLSKSSVPDGFEFTLKYHSGDSGMESMALLIQQNLADIGITVDLEAISTSEWTTLRYGGSETRDYEAMITLWGTDYPDPVGVVLPMYYSTNNVAGGSNWAEYVNSTFDALMDAQAAELDVSARAELLKEALYILDDEVPAAPLYIKYSQTALSDRVEYTSTTMQLYNVYFKDFKKAS